MARSEVVVDASFELGPRRADWRIGQPLEPVEVWFKGRRFTWHPGDLETYPVVTTPIADDADYEAERLATERFLSALAYDNKSATVLLEGATGYKRENDSPVLRQPRRPALIHRVEAELVVQEDVAISCVSAAQRPN